MHFRSPPLAAAPICAQPRSRGQALEQPSVRERDWLCSKGDPRLALTQKHYVDGAQAGGEEHRYVRGHAAGRREHGGAGKSASPVADRFRSKSTPRPQQRSASAASTPLQALDKYTIEKDVAAYIKKEFDVKHNPTWHCIVGRNFGGCPGGLWQPNGPC